MYILSYGLTVVGYIKNVFHLLSIQIVSKREREKMRISLSLSALFVLVLAGKLQYTIICKEYITIYKYDMAEEGIHYYFQV